jgi:hypothetical protein
MVRASRTRTCRCPMPRWRERRPGGSPGSASTSRSAPLPAGPQDLRRDICLGTQRAPSWSAVRRRPAPDSRRCPVRITSAIWSISPVMTRNSRQSSVLVPTIRSALRAGASAIRSIGAPGMISPSITRLPRHHTGRHLGAQRSGSGWARRSAFSSPCAVSSRSTRTAAIASRVGGTPSFSAKYCPIRCPSSAGITWCAALALRDRAPTFQPERAAGETQPRLCIRSYM